MHIGDRVRFSKQSGEGVILQLSAKGVAKIQLEDDFVVDLPVSELVPIAREEQLVFGRPESAADKPGKSKPKAFSKEGFYLAVCKESGNLWAWYVVNNTDFRLGVSLKRKVQGGERNEAVELLVLEPKTAGLFQRMPGGHLSEHTYTLDIIYHDEHGLFDFEPKRLQWRMSAKKLTAPQESVPVIGQKGYLFQLDKTKTLVELGGKAPPSVGTRKVILQRPPAVKDLHLQRLVKDSHKVSPIEASFLQLQAFEKHFHDCRASAEPEAVYIHGIGEGKLKKKLEQWLKRNRHLFKHYEEANPSEYGGGALRVVF